METCKNCFSPIEDLRKETRCSSCNSALHKECAIQDDGAFCDVCYTVKESEPEVIQFEIPDVIRRSYIETYRSCPHKFLKQVIEGREEPPTCYTQIGIDLHDLFEKACNNHSFTSEQMHDEFDEIWDNYDSTLFENDEQKEKMRTRSTESIDGFYEILRTLPRKPFVTEEKITFNIGDELPKVSITMDRIDEVDGELEMSDWKTGGVMVGKKLSSDLQAPLYIYAVQQHFNKLVRQFTFYYVQENKERVFVRDDIDPNVFICTVGKREYKINIIDAVREVQHIFSQIKKGNFNIPSNTKGMHFTCKMCFLRKQGECEGAEMQSWNQLGHKGGTFW